MDSTISNFGGKKLPVALNPLVRKLPTVAVVINPLEAPRSSDLRQVDVLSTIDEHAPLTPGTWICYLNEDIILRAEWHQVQLYPGDRVTFVDMPQGKDLLRGILYIALAYVSYGTSLSYTGVYAFAAALAVSVVGSFVINALLPLESRTQGGAAGTGASGAAVYSSSLSGNVAKLDQPIWRVCGRRKITPPFAAQPYFLFKEKGDPDGTGDNSDQYFYALYALGYGEVSIEQIQIGLTDIVKFSDVLVSRYLPPGAASQDVSPSVYSSSDVSGIELESQALSAAFVACGPSRKLVTIITDMICPYGLGTAQDDPLSVSWRVDARAIDDFGTPTGGWSKIGQETRSGKTATAQRWTLFYTVPVNRYEVRVVRTDVKNTKPGARHSLQWGSLKSQLSEPASLNANCAHYEIVLRSSQQLNQNTQSQVSFTLNAYVQPINGLYLFQGPILSRNPAWWLLDLARNPVWGLGIPTELIDLRSFYEYSLEWNIRQDRCDYVFTDSVDGWDALQLLARTGRARVFRRNGVLSIARDELLTMPVTAFTPRNTVPGSMTLHENLPTRDMPDGVIIQYEDYRTWLQTPIECPCPGFSAINPTSILYDPSLPKMQNPVRKTLDGIIGPTHALREGIYEAYSLAYRRTTTSCQVEMQGLIPAYLSPVLWQPELLDYGSSGDVVDWDPDTLTMTISEPTEATNDPTYLFLIRDDGSVTDPVQVYLGLTTTQIVLPAVPDFDLFVDSSQRERPKYILTTITDSIIKVSSITDGGKDESGAQLYTISGTVDDARVHTADLRFLSLEPQDLAVRAPFNDGVSPNLTDYYVQSDNAHDHDHPERCIIDVTFYQSGILVYTGNRLYSSWHGTPLRDDSSGITQLQVPDNWVQDFPVEDYHGAQYELRVTFLGGRGSLPAESTTGPYADFVPNRGTLVLGVWTNLANGITFGVDPNPDQSANFHTVSTVLCEIRDVASQTVQASCKMTLVCLSGFLAFSPGDGPGLDGGTGTLSPGSTGGGGEGGGGGS